MSIRIEGIEMPDSTNENAGQPKQTSQQKERKNRTMTKIEIIELFEQRPDIKELILEIISLPEEKRAEAIRAVKAFLEEKAR